MHRLLFVLLILHCFVMATTEETPSALSQNNSSSSAFHRFTLSFDPVSACIASLYLNLEGKVTPATSCFVEGMYTFPLISAPGYTGGGGVRYYYDSTHFVGLVVKKGKYRTYIPENRDDPNDYRFKLEYFSAGAHYGKKFTWWKGTFLFRIGLCYPIAMKRTWANGQKPTTYDLIEKTSVITPVLDSELSWRIPLPF